MALHLTDDDPASLDKLELYNVMRKVNWANTNDTSAFFEDFPEETR